MIELSDKEARKLTNLDREMRAYRSVKLILGYTVNRVVPISPGDDVGGRRLGLGPRRVYQVSRPRRVSP